MPRYLLGVAWGIWLAGLGLALWHHLPEESAALAVVIPLIVVTLIVEGSYLKGGG